MNWQEWIVSVIGLVVFGLVVGWLWRLFGCRKGDRCAACGQNCPLRREK